MKTISEAKIQLSSLVSLREATPITKNSKIVSVLVPYTEYKKMYRAWQKSMDLEAIEKARRFQAGDDISSLNGIELQNALDGGVKNGSSKAGN